MGKKVLIGIGIFVTLLGAIGTFNAVRSFGAVEEKRVDLEAEGVVSDKEITAVTHQLAGELDRTYYVEYKFTANDGKEYRNKMNNVEESIFNSLSVGDPIKIMYHSTQPSINGAPEYGTYTSVATIEKFTGGPTEKLIFCGTMLLVGIGMCVGGFFIPSGKKEG